MTSTRETTIASPPQSGQQAPHQLPSLQLPSLQLPSLQLPQLPTNLTPRLTLPAPVEAPGQLAPNRNAPVLQVPEPLEPLAPQAESPAVPPAGPPPAASSPIEPPAEGPGPGPAPEAPVAPPAAQAPIGEGPAPQAPPLPAESGAPVDAPQPASAQPQPQTVSAQPIATKSKDVPMPSGAAALGWAALFAALGFGLIAIAARRWMLRHAGAGLVDGPQSAAAPAEQSWTPVAHAPLVHTEGSADLDYGQASGHAHWNPDSLSGEVDGEVTLVHVHAEGRAASGDWSVGGWADAVGGEAKGEARFELNGPKGPQASASGEASSFHGRAHGEVDTPIGDIGVDGTADGPSAYGRVHIGEDGFGAVAGANAGKVGVDPHLDLGSNHAGIGLEAGGKADFGFSYGDVKELRLPFFSARLEWSGPIARLTSYPFLPSLSTYIWVAKALKNFIDDPVGTVKRAWLDVQKTATKVWETTTKAVNDAAAAAKKAAEAVEKAMQDAWDAIQKWFPAASYAVQAAIYKAWWAAYKAGGYAWDATKDATQFLVNFLGSITSDVLNALSAAWDTAKQVVGDVAGAVVGAVSGAWKTVTGWF